LCAVPRPETRRLIHLRSGLTRSFPGDKTLWFTWEENAAEDIDAVRCAIGGPAGGPAAWADNIAAAGDISQPIGGSRNDQATARLLAPSSGNGIGLVLALGDTQYECGEMENYLGAYDLSWGSSRESPDRRRGTTST
jgi:hypothetical protein